MDFDYDYPNDFDVRFSEFDTYWQGPGTRSTNDWLEDLRFFQKVCGFGSIPHKKHVPFGPVSQWILRMRRYAATGQLPLDLAAGLAVLGVPLEIDRIHQNRSARQENDAFERNVNQLRSWIDDQGNKNVANLTYLSMHGNATIRVCYKFLEHMKLKVRQGALKPEHLTILQSLPIQMNGTDLKDWLVPEKSVRAIEKMAGSNDPIKNLRWASMSKSSLAELIDVSEKDNWNLGIYLPGHGIETVTKCFVDEFGLTLHLASDQLLKFCIARYVLDDPTGVLMLFGANAAEKSLLFQMKPTPESRPLTPLKKASSTKIHGADTRPGKLLENGERFGGLTILDRIPRPIDAKRSGHFYSCRCDCGRVVNRQRDEILARTYATCGCTIQRNLAGQVFGKLTVLNESRRSKVGRNTEWLAECDCGKKTWVRAAALQSGKTRSCGCLRKGARTTGTSPPRDRRVSPIIRCLLTGRNVGIL